MRTGVSLAWALALAACGASTHEPGMEPSVPAAAGRPAPALPPAFADGDRPPERPRTVVLRGDPAAVLDPRRRGVSSSPPPPQPAGAPSSTFFPKEFDSRMFGGCSANDYTGGRCPEQTGRPP
jgi:hypothetical protein